MKLETMVTIENTQECFVKLWRRLGIGIRKVNLRALDAAYSIAFPGSTPINVGKKSRIRHAAVLKNKKRERLKASLSCTPAGSFTFAENQLFAIEMFVIQTNFEPTFFRIERFFTVFL